MASTTARFRIPDAATSDGATIVPVERMGQRDVQLAPAAQPGGRRREALDIYRKLPNVDQDRGDCLLRVGNVLYWDGRFEGARESYCQALEVYRRLKGAERQQADCLVSIGKAQVMLDRYAEALASWGEALEFYRRVGDGQEGQSDCLEKLEEAMRELRDATGSHEEDTR